MLSLYESIYRHRDARMSLGICHLISRTIPAHFTVNLHVDYLGTFGHPCVIDNIYHNKM